MPGFGDAHTGHRRQQAACSTGHTTPLASLRLIAVAGRSRRACPGEACRRHCHAWTPGCGRRRGCTGPLSCPCAEFKGRVRRVGRERAGAGRALGAPAKAGRRTAPPEPYAREMPGHGAHGWCGMGERQRRPHRTQAAPGQGSFCLDSHQSQVHTLLTSGGCASLVWETATSAGTDCRRPLCSGRLRLPCTARRRSPCSGRRRPPSAGHAAEARETGQTCCRGVIAAVRPWRRRGEMRAQGPGQRHSTDRSRAQPGWPGTRGGPSSRCRSAAPPA